MRKVRVLLTATGGLAGYSHYNLLVHMRSYSVDVIAADVRSDFNYNRFLGRPVHLLPRGEEPEFADSLLSLCLKEKVNVVFPCSSNEVVPLSRAKASFAASDIAVAVSDDPELLAVLIDKVHTYDMLAGLEEISDFIPRYIAPASQEDLQRGAAELAYPQQEIVFKPRYSQGGRGLTVLSSRPEVFFSSRGARALRLEWLQHVIGENISHAFLMEYLPGTEYSVDVLAYHGEAKIIIPRERIAVVDGKCVASRLVNHRELIDCARKIVSAFHLSYIVNLQFKENVLGQPKLLEVNPRVPAGLALDLAGGVNMFEEALNLIYKGEVSQKPNRWGIECARFFQELYQR